MATTGIYEWKDKKPAEFGSMVGAPKDPAAPTGAPTQGQSSTSMFGTTQANQTAMGGSFDSLLKAGPATSGPSPSFNDLFSGMGDTRAQNLAGAQQAISSGLNPSTPSAGSQVARNSFIKAQEEAERKVLEQAALGGRAETGQIVGDRREFLQKQALPARMDFEAQLQAQEEQQAQTRQQNAVGNLLALEGLGEQSRATAADLSLRERQLAQQGTQFKDELSFKKWATEGGWSQQEADRVWKSLEGDKDRAVTVSEGALGRELQKYLGDRGFAIDEKKLAETIRQFDSKLAFDEWATKAGLEDNEKARIWQGHLQDLDQRWQTGERLGAQDHQVLIEDKRIQAQQAAAEFERITNLEVLGKTQEWDREKVGIVQNYETLRAQQQMTHEQAMQVVRGDIETKLTQMGIDAQAARQAADIEVKKWEVDRQLAQQSTLANAELLYKYESLRQQTGLAKEELSLKALEITNQVEQFYKSFGLEEKRVESVINSQEMQDAIGVNTLLLEMAGDNPDMIQFATANFIKSMGGMKGPDGNPLLSPKEVESMLAELGKPAPAGPTNDFNLDDAFGRIGRGLKQIGSGDFLGGAMNTLGGQKDAVLGAGEDLVTGAKKVVKFLNPFD